MKRKYLILSSMVLGSLVAQPVLADTNASGRPSVDSVSSQDRTTERAERAMSHSHDASRAQDNSDPRTNDQTLPQDKNAVDAAPSEMPATRDEVRSETPQGLGVGELPKGDTTSPIKRAP